MTANEFKFAYKVRNALDESLHSLPRATSDRLASARKQALARKRRSAPLRVFMAQGTLAGQAGHFFREPISWLGRMSLALPLIVLVAGLVGLYQDEQQQRIADTAEIDALVLSDELPLSAYLDHGFNAYLAKRGD
ncbi:MAG: hypothetical protein JWQ23_2950 [Herminiimonas sp.]|nr:hypothetical protein [Herminiimonas sp.]